MYNNIYMLYTRSHEKKSDMVSSTDEGLIPTNDDGTWQMLRRKGVP